MLMKDGYAVEEQVECLVKDWPLSEQLEFQKTYKTDDGMLARTDLVRCLDDGQIDLYEIKSSTSLKSQSGDHVADAAFQVIAVERSGVKVRKVFIIHVDKTYIRHGDLDPRKLLKTVDVTEEARALIPALEPQIDTAMALAQRASIDEKGCDCRFKGTMANHCEAFEFFNSDIPDLPIYLLPRISASKTRSFVEEGRIALDAIEDDEVTPGQLPVLKSAKLGKPVTNINGIKAFLDTLTFPLYFYDYETFKSAIPISDGFRPHQQIPVQVSVHKLEEDGVLTHAEYLCSKPGQQRQLVEHLEHFIGLTGSSISWNKSFEISCNKDLALEFPEHASFLSSMNERTVDLMDVFKKNYVDIHFKGSTSIKKVLPVICPALSYDEMAVSDGADAMAAWVEMSIEQNPRKRLQMRKDLLSYCELDTMAMVEIYKFLDCITRQ